MVDEVKKASEKLAREIEQASANMRPEFKKLIDNIKEVNPELAKTTANLAKQSKDSFAGLLQQKKFAKQSGDMAKLQEIGLDKFKELDPQAVDNLTATFEKFGDGSFSIEQWATLQNEESKRLQQRKTKSTQLSNQEGKLAELQASFVKKEQAQSEKLKGLTDEQKEFAIDEYALLNKSDKEAIENQKETVERKKKLQASELEASAKHQSLSKELTERQEEVFGKLTEDSGRFGQFSEGLKDLTGIDLGGMADSMVKNVNALGKVFGNDDLFGGVVSSLGGGIASMAKGGFSMGGVMTTIGTMLSGVSTMIMSSFATFMVAAKAFPKMLMKVAGGLLKTAAKFLLTLPKLILSSLAFVGGLMLTAAGLLISALPFIAIGLAIVGVIGLLVAGFNYLMDNSTMFSNTINWLSDKFMAIVNFIMEVGGGVFDGIMTYIGDIFNGIFDFFGGVVDFIKAALSGDMGGMAEALGTIFDSLIDLFMAPFKFVKGLIMGVDPADEAMEENQEAAEKSGLYNKRGVARDSKLDESLIGDATTGQLEAIVADNDLSKDQMQMVIDEISQRKALSLEPASEPSGGQDISEGTTEVAEGNKKQTTANLVATNVSDNSSNSSITNIMNSPATTRNDDSTASRAGVNGRFTY